MMISNKKGLTLIEVLVVSAILVLVLGGILSFSIFGQKLYGSGSSQTELHSSVRLASERVNRQLRYARELKLLEDFNPDTASTEEYSYIYHDSENQQVMLLSASGKQTLSNPVITSAVFKVQGQTLLYTIQGKRGSSSFSLDSSVSPLNLNSISATGDNHIAVAFTLPQSQQVD